MSTAKVNVVKKARQDQGKCENCGAELKAGDGYLWFTVGFRSNWKHKRCLRSECFPRPSERESSKFASVMAAQEDFDESVGGMYEVDEIEAAVQAVADALNELRDEYDEALGAWEYGNEQLQEKVDHYESQAYEVDGWTWDGTEDWDRCDEHYDEDPEFEEDGTPKCEACAEQREDWIEQVRDAARDVVNSIEQL